MRLEEVFFDIFTTVSFKNCQFESDHSVFVVLMLMPHDESNFKVRVPMIDLFHVSRPKKV